MYLNKWLLFTKFEITKKDLKSNLDQIHMFRRWIWTIFWTVPRPCARDSWFVLNFRIVLLDLLVGCDVRWKKRFIRNSFRNPFQYEFNSIYNFLRLTEEALRILFFSWLVKQCLWGSGLTRCSLTIRSADWSPDLLANSHLPCNRISQNWRSSGTDSLNFAGHGTKNFKTW